MKKKKRSRPSKKGVGGTKDGTPARKNFDEEQKVLEGLVEAFGSITLEEAAAACKEANGDANKAAEILANSIAEDSATEACSTSSWNFGSCSASGSGSASGSSSGSSIGSKVFAAVDIPQNGARYQKGRPKRVVAAAGTVSTMLGKDYATSVQKRTSLKHKWFSEGGVPCKEEAEQFLCSMLGEECELSLGVVRDVLCQCGYDIDKALNILLVLSSACELSEVGQSSAQSKEDDHFFFEGSESLTDRTSDSTSHTSENEILDGFWHAGHLSRNGHLEPELPQKVLESLFNMPTPKSAEHDPKTMNWRNVARKMSSLGQTSETCPGDAACVQYSPAKGEEYQVFRQAAKQHWESMKFCYQKAATAFSNGGRDYAAYLSEQGRLENRRAQEADQKASQDIFKARNKDIENIITIDLHGQHVKQAMRLLKLHLLFGAHVHSVQLFRVITGCGSHVGKSKLKQSVINLLDREGIKWSEENKGTLLIRLDDQTEFSFLGSDSEDESYP